MTIGQRIAHYLDARGLKQKQLADAVKMSEKEISLLVNDKRPVFLRSVERINHLARALGVTPNDLVGDEFMENKQDTPRRLALWRNAAYEGSRSLIERQTRP